MNSLPNKIHIIGSVGSGKTTLARNLSVKLNIPYYELDNVVWIRDAAGDIRRNEEQRKEYLNSIVHSDSWIVEGVHNEEWVAKSFQQAEIIIFLDTNYSIRTIRIIKRFIMQRLGIERSHYKPTFEIFFKMFKWNRYFEDKGKPNFYKNYRQHIDKIIVITKNRQLDEIIKEVKKSV